MVLTVVVPVPAELPTANNRRRWTHWQERAVAEEMRATAKLCGASARNQAGLGRAEGKRYLTATLVRKHTQGRRHFDTDGCMAALKNAVDGLVDGGVLAGDNPAKLGWARVPDQTWGPADFVEFRVSDALTELAA